MYQIKHPFSSQFLPIRGLQYHLLSWGKDIPDQPIMVLLHGWMDVAASFQFLVDNFSTQRKVFAPDWRGYGQTQIVTDNFWFADYFADLDFILDHLSPDQPVDLVGHSMGGHIAMVYAGIRPERVRHLINLEGFGMARTQPSEAVGRYRRWLQELKDYQQGKLDLQSYACAQDVARRLMKNNPRLSEDKALWLATHWGKENRDLNQWQIQGHPAHKIINAHLYQVDEAKAIFSQIQAPTLCAIAENNQMDVWWQGKYHLSEFKNRLTVVPELQFIEIADSGHMMHHDQPKVLAQHIEQFVTP
ncbi:MAG: alpha/beta hydrolase [Gammaproteobacteria bacterium]|nr:alpha/beta hydrolase [Gammaproteobacteria bacterium]